MADLSLFQNISESSSQIRTLLEVRRSSSAASVPFQELLIQPVRAQVHK